MTKEQFDKYKFSVETEVLYNGEWNLVTEVNFGDGWIGVKETGYYLKYNEIEGIRN